MTVATEALLIGWACGLVVGGSISFIAMAHASNKAIAKWQDICRQWRELATKGADANERHLSDVRSILGIDEKPPTLH